MLESKFWQAFFALAPMVGLFLVLFGYGIFIFYLVGIGDSFDDAAQGPAALWGIGVFVAMVLLLVAISFGSLVYYIVHAVKNPNLQQNNLLLVWILLFVFANGIGQLIYWIVEVLPHNGRSTAP